MGQRDGRQTKEWENVLQQRSVMALVLGISMGWICELAITLGEKQYKLGYSGAQKPLVHAARHGWALKVVW